MLPWVALSWYQRQFIQKQKLSGEGIPGATASIPIGQVGQKTCLLTAITLILFGGGQILRINYQKAGSSTLSSVNLPKLNVKSVQASLSQIVSVALPIFAALKVGGFLVAFSLLLATASGFPAMINGTSRTQEIYSR